MNADENDTIELIGAELSNLQHCIVIAVVLIGACLSAFSSIRILLLQRNAKDGQQTYHRLIFSMSVADVFFSLCCLLQLFLVDKEKTVQPWAIGNETSCSGIGFIFTFFYFVIVIHNALLSLHFWLIVVRKWTPSDMKKYFHRQSAVVAWVLPLLIQLYTVLSSRYVQTSIAMICFSDRDQIPEKIEVAWLGIACLIATVFTVWVYIFYKKKIEITLARSSYASSFATQAQDKRSKKLARRSVAYFLVYLNTLLWTVALNILARFDDDIDLGNGWVFALRLISWIFLPLQGFFNMMVYVQPMITQKRKDHPEFSEWKIFLWLFVYGKVPDSDNSSGEFDLSLRESGVHHLQRLQNRKSNGTTEDENEPGSSCNFLRVSLDGALSGSLELRKSGDLAVNEEEISDNTDTTSSPQVESSKELVILEEDTDAMKSSRTDSTKGVDEVV